MVNLYYFSLVEGKEREKKKKKKKKDSGVRAYDKSQVIVTEQLSLKQKSQKDKYFQNVKG